MIIPVRMLAFHDVNTVRPVFIPDDKIRERASVYTILDLTFEYGQNEFCQGPDADKIRTTTCSVSVGDVVEIDNTPYMVMMAGFKKLSQEEYDNYKAIPKACDRVIHAYGISYRD